MKPYLKRLLGLALLLAGAGGVAWSQLRDAPAAPAAASAVRVPPSLRVSGIVAEAAPFRETISASGTLRAEESVELQTEVNGKISIVRFQEGERVEEGELLVKIDDTSLQAMLRRAEARRELAAFRERRLAQLVDEGGISRQAYDEARAEVAINGAEIDVIRADIAKTEIRAPFTGIVGLRFVSPGAYVNSATRIATLQNTRELKVDFSVPERYAPRVRPGDPIRFSVAGSDRAYTGEVIAVEPRVDVATRSVLLRARCGNSDGSLVPGSFARVDYTVQQSEASLLVPAIAVLSGLEERSLFIEREGRAERLPVTTGARTASHVQITSGLQPGDVVLTSGLQQLRSGTSITVDLSR